MQRAVLLLLATTTLWAHPDRIEDRLLFHFATGEEAPADGRWRDLTDRVTAGVKGAPVLTNLGPALALRLDGASDWIEVAGNAAAAGPLLPKRECSISAWVGWTRRGATAASAASCRTTARTRKGWLLGYDGDRFSWALASEGPADRDGQLTSAMGR